MRRTWIGVAACLLLTAGVLQAQEVAPTPKPETLYLADPQQMPQPPQPAPVPQPAIAPRAPMPPDLGKWWKDSEIVQELQLSESQIVQLEQAFLDHRLRLIDLRAAVEREETRLQPMIEADQLDLAKVSAQLDVVLAARGKLEKENTMMMLSLRKVLTVEQWKKLQDIHGREVRYMSGPRIPKVAPGLPRKKVPPPGQPPAPPQD